MADPIVVGVDEHSALSAVTWAAREAVLRGASLTLVSVTARPGSAGVPIEAPAGVFEGADEDAETLLARAKAIAMTVVQGRSLEITSVHSIGSPVPELLSRGRNQLRCWLWELTGMGPSSG